MSSISPLNKTRFERHLPGVLGVESVPDKVLEDIFDAYDGDMSGIIDMKEF